MKLLVLTDRQQSAAAGRDLVDTVAAAVAAGAPAVLYREKDLPAPERRALGERVAAACGPASLLVASDPALAQALGAVAIHLSAADPWPEDRSLTVGRSCHSAAELAEAERQGAAYATVSPVFVTASKPGYGPALGLDGLAEMTARSALPVVALGGIDADNGSPCLAAGAAGIAVMGGVMGAADPGAVVRSLLDLEVIR